MDAESGDATDTPLRPHVPVEVTGDTIRAGAASKRFRPGDARSLLTAYLGLIRSVRDQRRARTIELRRTDVEALAGHLGLPGDEVVERLAALMGATRSQRASMITLFGAGALVIGLAGTAAVRAGGGSGDDEPRGPAVAPASDAVVTTQVPTTTVAVTVPAPTTVPTTTMAPPAVETTIVLIPPPTIVDPPSPLADPPPQSAPRGPAVTSPPATDAPTDDTAVTDIGTPPVPPATDAPTDSTAVTDIGTPPVPPATDAPTDDTAVTDIGTPPVPPATDAPADTPPPDSAVVTDIGTPPIPPTTVAVG